MFRYNSLKLQQKIVLPMIGLVLIITLLISLLYYVTLSDTVETQIGKRALHVASTVASMKEVKEAFQTDDPSKIIQPIAEKIRIETGAEFVVVGNTEGVRYSHPIPERIGKKMVGGDNQLALLYGQSYTSKATGTLGPSLRGKVPIVNEAGYIIGVVSVGFLMEDIREIVRPYSLRILFIAFSGILIGIIGSVFLSRNIKNSLSGYEPKDIASLYQEREAVIQSVREGIIVVNRKGDIALVNHAAFEILELGKDDVVGKPVAEVIPNSKILEVLHEGKEQLDRQMYIKDKEIIVNRLPVKIDNTVIGVVSSFRLKSEIDQLRKELSQVKLYTEALRAQTHEHNNLLYTISGLLQLEAYEEAVKLIQNETETHKEFSQFIIKNINDPMLSGIVLGFYNRAKELKVELILDRESSLNAIPKHVEANALVSILGNLITNSFEAIEHKKENERKIRVFITDVGDDLLLEVEDNGDGISQDIIPLLFDRGFSTKKGENRGNGLARIKEVVNELNGTISIEEGDWGGALFLVAIPKRGEKS